jgi:hypothetical protein
MSHPLVRCAVAISAIAALSQLTVAAGGPLMFDTAGPITWATTQTIEYRIDTGRLGPFDDPLPQKLAQAALDRWSQASTTLTFQRQPLRENVTSAVQYLELENDNRAGNVLVFDDAGDIVAHLTGEANRANILGWTQPSLDGRKIGRFVALINGALAGNKAFVERTLTHQFGHALGLDHSQINSELANNRNGDDDRFLPTMFPTSTDHASSLGELNPDDIAWIRQLYPSATTRRLYGTLVGRLERQGRPVLGANVIAIRTAVRSVDAASPLMDRFSCVSEYLGQGNGAFRIQVLPGVYRLRIEPVGAVLSGGSSSDPYADTPSGLSFFRPVAVLDRPEPLAIDAGATVEVGTVVVR